MNSYLRAQSQQTQQPLLNTGLLGALQPIAGNAIQAQAPINSFAKPTYTYDKAALDTALKDYSIYDTSALGGLAQYFKPKAAAAYGNQMFFKPEDFQAATNQLGALDKAQIEALPSIFQGLQQAGTVGNQVFYDKSVLDPQLAKFTSLDANKASALQSLLGDVQSTGRYGDNLYFDKAAFDAQMGKYGQLTNEQLQQYSYMPALQSLAPLLEVDGTKLFDKQALTTALQNPWGDVGYNPSAGVANSQWWGGPWKSAGGMDALNAGISVQKALQDAAGFTTAEDPFGTKALAYDPWVNPVGSYSTTNPFQQLADKQKAQYEAEFREFQRASAYNPFGRSELTFEQWMNSPERTFDESYGLIPEQAVTNTTRQDVLNNLASQAQNFGQLTAAQQSAIDNWKKLNTSEQLDKELRSLYPGQSYTENNFTGNYDNYVNTLNYMLKDRGLNSLAQVGKDQATGKLYDKATGREINPLLGTFKGGSGDGNLTLSLVWNDKLGIPVIANKFKKPEAKAADIIGNLIPGVILGMAAGPAAGALSSGLTSSLGATGAALAGNAIAYGTAGGLGNVAHGGDFGQGFLSGAAGGALGAAGQALQGVNAGQALLGANSPAWAQAAINQGLGGAIGGAMQGGWQGALSGGLSGAAGGALGSYMGGALQNSSPLVQNLGKIGTSAITGGLKSALSGQDFGTGALGSIASGLGNIGQQYVAKQFSDLGLPAGALQNKGASILGGITNQFIRNQLMQALQRG